MSDLDEIQFLPEDDLPPEAPSGHRWKLLIVDDDSEVHRITRLILAGYRLEGRELEISSAYDSRQAREWLTANPDTAVVLLDVVMETEDAGLKLVKWIRDTWKNQMIRIILRTGQPGAAPEKEVIREYRINDYKAKTELTELKLYTSVTVAIRSYQDLKMLQRSEEGFHRIVTASGELFRNRSKEKFYTGVLLQLTSLMRLDEDSLILHADGIALQGRGKDFLVIAATGDFSPLAGKAFPLSEHEDLRPLVERCLEVKDSFFENHYFVSYFPAADGGENIILFRSSEELPSLEKEMIRVFSGNISIAFANLDLSEQIESTQREMIYTLGELVESRSRETGNHVRRVGSMVAWLGQKAGLDPREAELMALASPMHDIGKIGIPDEILNKPGLLSPKELDVMRQHAIIGYQILKTGGGILSFAASIARSHHEFWDGNGYPDGLSGEDIPIGARLTALCDVFDALFHTRKYKGPWDLEMIKDYFLENRGKQFDPRLHDLFFEDLSPVLEIMERWPD